MECDPTRVCELLVGLPAVTVLQVISVFATAQKKVAEAASRLFHFYVHERFRAEGLHGAELMATTRTVADPLNGMIEPAVLYFHRKARERAFMEDIEPEHE